MDLPRRGAPLVLAGVLAGAGATHLLAPGVYEPLIPHWLGAARPWVTGSGLAELACAAAVAHPRTRRAGGWASAALLVGVFPANLQMAVDWGDRSAVEQTVAWARLPLQVPLVWWAVRVARQGFRSGGASG